MIKSTTPKLKIGFVLDDGLDKPDGVQQYILSLGDWFKQNGHEIRYLVGETTRKDLPDIIELSKNLKVSFNGNKLSIPIWPKLGKIKSVLKNEKFDVIHIQLPFSPVMGGRVLANLPKNTAVAGTFHILPLSNSSLYHLGNKATALSIRSGINRIDKNFAVSKPAQDFAKDVYKIDCEILGNPIKIPENTPARKKSSEIFKIVFLGRLVHRKGCLTLLKAVNNLDSTHKKKVRIKIGGVGSEAKKLEEYVKSNNLNRIVSFSGFIDEKDKMQFLRDSDIAVFPAKGGESFGIVLTEAMASSGPVVLAGDNPGYRSVIESDDALFNPNDYTALSDKIKAYMNNPESLNELFNRQQKLVKNYDINKIGERLLVNFTAIVQNKNK